MQKKKNHHAFCYGYIHKQRREEKRKKKRGKEKKKRRGRMKRRRKRKRGEKKRGCLESPKFITDFIYKSRKKPISGRNKGYLRPLRNVCV